MILLEDPGCWLSAVATTGSALLPLLGAVVRPLEQLDLQVPQHTAVVWKQ